MSTLSAATATRRTPLEGVVTHRNLSVAVLVEHALRRGEGVLASNGALACDTGERTGRSPNDKYLEDTPGIHANIDWGKVNQPMTPAHFSALEAKVMEHMRSRSDVYRFDGYAGADPAYRLRVSVFTEEAWHALFARTLFINADGADLPGWAQDWTVINACNMKVDNPSAYGAKGPVIIAQSLERKLVLIVGTRYAGEMKKSIFYAMNHDLPDMGVFPMHCSCNVSRANHDDVALFFGLSGTGKTTLSADPNRDLVGDDEHGWSDTGVFNMEGGCYAKCIKLSRDTEPEIWDAIRFGSVLENTVVDPHSRAPDYDSAARTENTRVTYPVSYMRNARVPSMAGHPRNVIFLTADAFGVLPPVARLSPEQAMYYFLNGYTSKLAGTEAGITEPTPNFSACFGGPFMPRPPMRYAEMLRDRIAAHKSDVWLLNTGWTGGPYGVGSRFKLPWTRAFVNAIVDGSLKRATFAEHPIFRLQVPTAVSGVPADVLDPRKTWRDGAAYDAGAKELARKFRENDTKYALTPEVRAAGPVA